MPAQTSPSPDDLLRLLHAATDNNALQWKETAEVDTFRTELGFGMVRLSKVSADPSYLFSVVDDEGTLLDEYQPSGEGELIAIESLYKKVRRRALNLEFKMKGVIQQLKSLAGEP